MFVPKSVVGYTRALDVLLELFRRVIGRTPIAEIYEGDAQTRLRQLTDKALVVSSFDINVPWAQGTVSPAPYLTWLKNRGLVEYFADEKGWAITEEGAQTCTNIFGEFYYRPVAKEEPCE